MSPDLPILHRDDLYKRRWLCRLANVATLSAGFLSYSFPGDVTGMYFVAIWLWTLLIVHDYDDMSAAFHRFCSYMEEEHHSAVDREILKDVLAGNPRTLSKNDVAAIAAHDRMLWRMRATKDGNLPLDQLVIKYYHLYTETIWTDLFRATFLLCCVLRAPETVLCVMWMSQVWASSEPHLWLLVMPILAILGMQIRDDETLETVLNQPDWVHRLELFGQRILISGPNDQLIPHKAIKDKFNARKKPAHVALYTWTDGRIL